MIPVMAAVGILLVLALVIGQTVLEWDWVCRRCGKQFYDTSLSDMLLHRCVSCKSKLR